MDQSSKMSEPGIFLNAKNPVYEDRMTREENPHNSVICESEMPGVVWQGTVSAQLFPSSAVAWGGRFQVRRDL